MAKRKFAYIAIFLLFWLLVLLLNNAALARTRAYVQKTADSQAVQRIYRFLEQEGRNFIVSVRDYAVWDETYIYFKNPEDNFVQSNFFEDTFSNMSLDYALGIDTKGKVVFALRYDRTTTRIGPASAAQIKFLTKLVDIGPSGSGLTSFNGDVFQYAYANVTDSYQKRSPAGSMLFVRDVTYQELGKISTILGAEVYVEAKSLPLPLEGKKQFTVHPIYNNNGQHIANLLYRDNLEFFNISSERRVFFWLSLLSFGVFAVVAWSTLLREERAQAKRLSTEQQYNSLLSQLEEGVVIADAASQTIVEVNPAFAQLLQVEPQSLVGQKLSSVLSAFEHEFDVFKTGAYVEAVAASHSQKIEVDINTSAFGPNKEQVLLVVYDATERKRVQRQHYVNFVNKFFGIIFEGIFDPPHIEFIGGALFRQMEVDPNSLLGDYHTLLSYVHPDDRDRVQQHVINFLATKQPMRVVEYRSIINDKLYWFSLALDTFYKGSVLHSRGTVYDLTLHKQTSQALDNTSQMLQKVTDAMTDVVIFFDPDGTVVYATPSWKSLASGQTPALEGKNLIDLVDKELSAYFFKMALEATPSTSYAQHEFEFKLFEQKYIFDARINFLFDEFYNPDGERSLDTPLTGVVVGLRDVTKRRGIEMAMREREQMLSRITNAMTDVVLLVGQDALIKYATPSIKHVLGMEADSVVGNAVASLIGEQDSYQIKHLLRGAIPQSSTVTTTLTVTTPHRGVRVLETSIHYLAEHGKSEGAVASLRDVTEAHRSQKAVQDSEMMLRRITSTMRDAVGFVGPDLEVLYATPSLVELCGVLQPGQTFMDYVYLEDRQEVLSALEQALRRGASFTLEHRCNGVQGGTVWVETIFDANYNDHQVLLGAAICMRNISDRVVARSALLERERQLSQITNNIKDVVMLMDLHGVVQYVTPSIQSVLGYIPQDMVGTSAYTMIDEADRSMLRSKVWAALNQDQTLTVQYQAVSKFGKRVWVEGVISLSVDQEGAPSIVVVMRDITDRKAQDAQVEHLAYSDDLTQLPNRRSFRAEVERSIGAAQQFALLYLDLDNFKVINDNHGHDVGDELLIEAANMLKQQIASSDVLARIGGDEFACMLAGADEAKAKEVATQMSDALRGNFNLSGKAITLAVSVGVALFPEHANSYVDLLKLADIAMYQAKNRGDKVVVFDFSSRGQIEERAQIEQRLRIAVANSNINPIFQPIWNLKTGQVSGFEALAFWNDVAGPVGAGYFIPVAESCGLVDQIDLCITEKSLECALAWASFRNLSVSVNVSAQTLASPLMCKRLATLIQNTSLPPSHIILELTESSLLRNPDEARIALERFKSLGVRIALDDFGAGYASLGYLKQLPLDRVKIDRSFVSQIGLDNRDERLIKASIEIAHSLDLEVVAEGVETAEQAKWLQDNNCDYIQGYWIGRPNPNVDGRSLERLEGVVHSSFLY